MRFSSGLSLASRGSTPTRGAPRTPVTKMCPSNKTRNYSSRNAKDRHERGKGDYRCTRSRSRYNRTNFQVRWRRCACGLTSSVLSRRNLLAAIPNAGCSFASNSRSRAKPSGLPSASHASRRRFARRLGCCLRDSICPQTGVDNIRGVPRAAAAISRTVGRESGRGHRQSGHQARAGELFDNALAGAADAQAAARPMLGCAFTSREPAGLSSIRPTASSAIAI